MAHSWASSTQWSRSTRPRRVTVAWFETLRPSRVTTVARTCTPAGVWGVGNRGDTSLVSGTSPSTSGRLPSRTFEVPVPSFYCPT